MTRQVHNWCERYLAQVTSNNLRSLAEVYVKPSAEKKAAWSKIQAECNRKNGWGLSIICSNIQTFTAAFTYKDVNGEPIICIISRTRSIEVYVSTISTDIYVDALFSYKETE